MSSGKTSGLISCFSLPLSSVDPYNVVGAGLSGGVGFHPAKVAHKSSKRSG